jgi:hypothetical protein
MPTEESEVLICRDEIVRIHLDRLQAIVETPTRGIAEAVQASIALRVLFDGALNQTGRAHEQQLMIPAPDTTGIPLGHALFFACGGYDIGGVAYVPAYLYREPGLKSQHRAQFEEHMASSPRKHNYRDFKLKAFLKSPCLAFMGKIFTREETVRYVANKCGGAHHSDNTIGFKDFEKHLTTLGRALHLDGTSAVFLETLGTAALLMSAPTVGKLRAKLPTSPALPANSTALAHSSNT